MLVYVSCWLKRHHPAAFTGALLNSQPMGFYAPAQLVADARQHGVEVRPVDVTVSDWDCTLEEMGTIPLSQRRRKAQAPQGKRGEARGPTILGVAPATGLSLGST